MNSNVQYYGDSVSSPDAVSADGSRSLFLLFSAQKVDSDRAMGRKSTASHQH